MHTLKGKSIAGGIAAGRLKILRRHSCAVEDRPAENIGIETERFEAAAEKTAERLDALYTRTLEISGPDNADIFKAHAMILKDEVLLSPVRALIAEGHCAEYAVRECFETQAALFDDMDSEYMKARGEDIRDLERAVLDVLTGADPEDLRDAGPCILAVDELPPSYAASLDRSSVLAVVTGGGSAAGHTAILLRALAVPALIQCPGMMDEWDGMEAIVDGDSACVYIDPDDETLMRMTAAEDKDASESRELQKLKGRESVTADGRRISIYANIGGPEDIDPVIENDAEGVGLFRSEFLYLGRASEPTEEEQFLAYREVLERLAPRRVIIRTCDIGADKQAGYLGLEREDNPALGCRAIRICLERKDFFKRQLRAILRASAYGNCAVMFPMITSLWELREAKQIMAECREELQAEGIRTENIETGIMTETPAAVLTADELAQECDFFSIGTNDLTQYICAADRQNYRVDKFLDAHHPAVLRAISMTAEAARRHGIRVGICGELAADTTLTETFIRMGIDELSVNPRDVLLLRRAVRSADLRERDDNIKAVPAPLKH